RQRAYRAAPPLPPPPAGVAVLTRQETAARLGMDFSQFGKWEMAGRVPLQRYRVQKGSGRTMYYAAADVERFVQELAEQAERERLESEPYPDPQRAGVYRLPIRLHGQRAEVLIDAADVPKVQGKLWSGYARKRGEQLEVMHTYPGGRRVLLKLVLLGIDAQDDGQQIIGYANGDPLDCRRENLVVKTMAEVIWSREKSAVRKGRTAVSKYKGVAWDSTRRLWRLQVGGKAGKRSVERFRDEAEAAAAYDAVARRLGGPSARLNFPDGNVPAPTYLGPDGQPVREKNDYRVPRGLPRPPEGVKMLTGHEAAAVLGIAEGTFDIWVVHGQVPVARYRDKDQTGTPILYPAAEIQALRQRLDAVGQPYPDSHPARAGVWRVPLGTLSGYVEALIDAADLPIVQGKRWNYVTPKGKSAKSGAVMHLSADGTQRVLLKRLIMGLQDDGPTTQITHRNGNPLDCRRENLMVHGSEKSSRACFKKLARRGKPTSSRFKGVCWNESQGVWVAQINIDNVHKRLGCFDDEEDAAFAYDAAAREAWGAEARVNFPRPGERPSAAAPCAPADLSPESKASAARPPGKPTDFAAVLHADGSVTISWRSSNAAASSGVTFAISRKLPGQREFVRIGIADGTTSDNRRPFFIDATVPIAALSAEDRSAEYLIQGSRGLTLGEASDVLVVRFDTAGVVLGQTGVGRAA
nr:AP2 domain-containing protein [Phycisphaerales bacterium]